MPSSLFSGKPINVNELWVWDMVINANAALIAAAKATLDQKTQAALTNLFLGIPDRIFVNFYNRLYNK